MTLTDGDIREIVYSALEPEVVGERVLILVPDHTRVLPLDRVLPALVEALHRAASLEVMVALGTHPRRRGRLFGLGGIAGGVYRKARSGAQPRMAQ